MLGITAANLRRVSGPTSPRWRAVRGGTFAAVAALLAMMGHAVGGGDIPDPSVVLLPAVALGFVMTSAGDRSPRPVHRPRPVGLVFGVLAAGQLAFHLLFSVTAHTGAGMGGEPLDLTRMIVFHLVAAAGTALVVARGEAALFRLFEAVRKVATPPPVAARIDPWMPWTAVILDVYAAGPGGWLPDSAPRRGPPSH